MYTIICIIYIIQFGIAMEVKRNGVCHENLRSKEEFRKVGLHDDSSFKHAPLIGWPLSPI